MDTEKLKSVVGQAAVSHFLDRAQEYREQLLLCAQEADPKKSAPFFKGTHAAFMRALILFDEMEW